MITTIQPGFFTTVQDEGRWGYQAFGMPVAGAMDRYAYRVANLLVGNKPAAAALEMTIKGGHFRFEQDCYASICGADMGATLNGAPIVNWSCFFAPAGSELAFEYVITGCRTYLAVQGGMDVPIVLGSRSTYTRGAVGGVDGRALRAGDVVPVGADWERQAQVITLPAQFVPLQSDQIELRVLLGPQDDHFTETGLKTLFNNTYTISSEADRMGYRMEGAIIEHKGKADIVSDALCQGAVQIPGHGLPIIMMADRGTTGGYTKAGAVIGPDLRLLAQAKPDDKVTLKPCSEEEAAQAFLAEQERYGQIQAALLQEGAPPATTGLTRQYRVAINKQVFQVQIEEVE